jgi:hypothetical protein
MKELPVLDARAAFCDVGSEHVHVSIAGGAPKVFGTATTQLHALRDWLLSENANSVAMEATGMYWLPLYSILEDAGQAVPGQRSDGPARPYRLQRAANRQRSRHRPEQVAHRETLYLLDGTGSRVPLKWLFCVVARSLAAMFWRVMVKGLDLVEQGLAAYEVKNYMFMERYDATIHVVMGCHGLRPEKSTILHDQ